MPAFRQKDVEADSAVVSYAEWLQLPPCNDAVHTYESLLLLLKLNVHSATDSIAAKYTHCILHATAYAAGLHCS